MVWFPLIRLPRKLWTQELRSGFNFNIQFPLIRLPRKLWTIPGGSYRRSVRRVSINSTSEEVVNDSNFLTPQLVLFMFPLIRLPRKLWTSLPLLEGIEDSSEVSINSTSEEVVNPTPLNPIHPGDLKPCLRGIAAFPPFHPSQLLVDRPETLAPWTIEG